MKLIICPDTSADRAPVMIGGKLGVFASNTARIHDFIEIQFKFLTKVKVETLIFKIILNLF